MRVSISKVQNVTGGIVFKANPNSLIDINVINFLRISKIDDMTSLRKHFIKEGIIHKDSYKNILDVPLSAIGLYIAIDLGYSGILFDDDTLVIKGD